MLAALTPATRIFVAVAPVDLRRGFDGLSAHVETVLQQHVVEGGLFKWPYDCTRLGAKTSPVSNHPSISSLPRTGLRGG